MTNDLSTAMRFYFEGRSDDFDDFAKRHRRRFGRQFLADARDGNALRNEKAVDALRRIVAFGPDLRRKRTELNLSASKVAHETGISPSRLSRVERLKGELSGNEKKAIDRVIARHQKERDRRLKIEVSKARGRVIRIARNEAGMTQAQLAALIKVERKSIIRWEQGSPMTDITLHQLERRLKLSGHPDRKSPLSPE